MNDINNTPSTPGTPDAVVDIKHYYIDAEGNRVEIPFDGASEAAPEETTFVAEVGADHEVTVH